MGRRATNRRLHVVAIWALFVALLLPLLPAASPVLARQDDQETAEARERQRARERRNNRNQAENLDETPVAGETAVLDEAIEDLSVGAQDDGATADPNDAESAAEGELPVEIDLDGERFLYDRQVPIDPADLVEVGEQDGLAILAADEQAPFTGVYAESPTQSDSLARYLAQVPLGDDGAASAGNPCPAQAQPFGDLPTPDGTYAFAGLEEDVTTDGLGPIFATQTGETVYAPSGEVPPTELFIDSANGLLRFVLLDDQGRPPVLGDELAFGGQRFGFEGDVAGSVDPATLAPIGCAGPFQLLAAQGETEAPYGEVFAQVGSRLFGYLAQEGDASGTVEETATGEAVTAEPTIEGEPAETAAVETAADETPFGETATAVETAVLDETIEAVETVVAEETVAAEGTVGPEETAGAETAAAQDEQPSVAVGDLQREISVEGARYFLDRTLPVDTAGFVEIGDSDGVALFAPEAAPPFSRVFAGVDQPGRYFPEVPIGTDGTASVSASCPADAAAFQIVDLGGPLYAYGGVESDLTVDQLQEITTTGEGDPIYAESADTPFPELYIDLDGTLNRFILLDDQGLPGTLADSITFGGQTFSFDGEVTGQVDPTTLDQAGCAGVFPARSNPGESAGALGQLFVVLNDATPRVLAFSAQDVAPGATAAVGVDETATAPAATEIPTEAPTEIATQVPTEVPTETAIPTELPTETPVPTETAVPPTETPLPTETSIPPTATPEPTATLPPPTDAPLPTETPQPPTETAVPPTAAPVPTETPVSPPANEVVTAEPAETASVVPTAAPETPVATEAPAPPSDAAPTPLVLATVAPPATPFSPIAVDAPPPIPPEFPQEIEVQGIRYSFDLQVDVDPQTLTQVDVVQAPDSTLTVLASQDDTALAGRRSYLRQGALEGPFTRIFVVQQTTGIIARYVSQVTFTSGGTIALDNPCSSEAQDATFAYTFNNQSYQYTYASVEVNVSIEELRTTTVAAVGQIPVLDGGRELFIRSGASQFSEVFVSSGGELQRFVALNAIGAPVTLNELVFAETRFSVETEVSVNIQQAGFRRVGCSGAFPIYAPPAQASAQAPLSVCFTVVDNRVYQFQATTIVEAPRGQVPAPVAVVAPPAGVVQITLQYTQPGPAPTALPNVRPIPLPTQPGAAPSPTPVTGVIGVRPISPRQCSGDPGQIGANGVPERLPRRIQLSGIAYSFVRQEEVGSDVRLTRLGCVGPFEAAQAEGTDATRVIYLRVSRNAETVYRFEAATSFEVQFTVTGNAQAITANDANYNLGQTWQRSLYSSVTAIVYAEDPNALDPGRIYAVKVEGDVIAEYVPEGGDVVQPSDELVAAAEAVGVNPDLVLGGGRRYLLVSLWLPVGTTTNGFVTLYSSVGEGVADTLLATDPRSLDLFIYRRSGT